MNQKPFFEAVDDRRRDEVFSADILYRHPSGEVVGKDIEDHGKGVGQIGDDEIRQERMGPSAGALHAGDFQAEHFRLSGREDDEVTLIASPSAAGAFCAAVRADMDKQRVL